MVYGLNTWLPKLMMEVGYATDFKLRLPDRTSSGAIVGTLIIARLCDKYGSKKMLVPMYASRGSSLNTTWIRRKYLSGFMFSSDCRSSYNRARKILYKLMCHNIIQPILDQPPWGLHQVSEELAACVGPLLGGFLLSVSLPIQLNLSHLQFPV